VVLLLKDKAEVIEHGDWNLRSESQSIHRPVVIRLVTYVRIPRDTHRRKITRRAVFARDRWTCQYCGARSNLTVDHVIPQSKGAVDVRRPSRLLLLVLIETSSIDAGGTSPSARPDGASGGLRQAGPAPT